MAFSMDDYRKGMSQGYRKNVDYALQQTRQRESLTGRRSSPQERAAIVSGVLRPYAQSYGQEYLKGLALQESSRQWDKSYDLQKDALKQQKKADEISGIAEFAKLGLGAASVGNQMYSNYQGGQTVGTSSYGPWTQDDDPSLDMSWEEYDQYTKNAVSRKNTGWTMEQLQAGRWYDY